jgi:hypothetical protein
MSAAGVGRFAMGLAAIPDAEVRLVRFGAWAREAPALDVVDALQGAMTASPHPTVRTLQLTVVHWLAHIAPRPRFPAGVSTQVRGLRAPANERLAHLYVTADGVEALSLATLLRRAFRASTPDDARLLPLPLAIESISLGHRRARARRPDAARFEPLLLDSTPAVVHLLAQNPRLNETQILKTASNRPTHPQACVALLMTTRWLGRERAREAVARNPATPQWLVLALAPVLPPSALAHVVRSGRLERDILEALRPIARGPAATALADALAAGSRDPAAQIHHVDLAFDGEPLEVAELWSAVEADAAPRPTND